MTPEQARARIAELEAANAATDGWGAAVGARGEEIKELKSFLTRSGFAIGDQVEKYTGDYRLCGEVRAVVVTRAGKVRYVVEHEPGFLHIYSEANLRLSPAAGERELTKEEDDLVRRALLKSSTPQAGE